MVKGEPVDKYQIAYYRNICIHKNLERFHPCGNSHDDSLQQEPLFEYHPYQCGSLEYVEINLSSEH